MSRILYTSFTLIYGFKFDIESELLLKYMFLYLKIFFYDFIFNNNLDLQ